MRFAKVYDYVAGKKSWGSFGLPREGTNVPERTAADAAHRDVPTCALEEAMSTGPSTVRPSIGTDALLERMRSRNLTSYLVTTPDGRLVGLVRRDELEQSRSEYRSESTAE